MAGRDLYIRVPANGQVNVSAAGRFVFVKAASTALQFETEEGKNVLMEAGDKLVSQFPSGFAGFVIHNPTAAAATTTLTVGFGDFDKAAVVGTITVSKSSGGAALADVAVGALANVVVSPVSPARREILVTNLSLIDTLRLNLDAAATATLGQPVLPTQTITLTTTGQVNVYNPGAATSVAVLEVND